MNRDTWLIILGAILAFSGGLVAFFIQSWWNKRVQRKVVHDFLLELIRDFERVSPRIIETYEKSGILWNDLLNQLNDDLALYERNREHSILLQDLELRAAVWEWFSRLRTFVNMTMGLNNMIGVNPNNQWAKEEIKKQVDKIKSLKTDSTQLANQLNAG